jgi:hypothetical protein
MLRQARTIYSVGRTAFKPHPTFSYPCPRRFYCTNKQVSVPFARETLKEGWVDPPKNDNAVNDKPYKRKETKKKEDIDEKKEDIDEKKGDTDKKEPIIPPTGEWTQHETEFFRLHYFQVTDWRAYFCEDVAPMPERVKDIATLQLDAAAVIERTCES